jgi:CHASE2 domain-containing sensor protein
MKANWKTRPDNEHRWLPAIYITTSTVLWVTGMVAAFQGKWTSVAISVLTLVFTSALWSWSLQERFTTTITISRDDE